MGRHRHRHNRRRQVFSNETPSRHHRLPRSRKENDYSIQFLPKSYHESLHILFHNLTLPEMHQFLDILYSRGSWTSLQIHEEINRIRNASNKHSVPIREEKVILITPNFLNSYFHRGNHLLDKKTHRFSF